jgi:hypothetical protein
MDIHLSRRMSQAPQLRSSLPPRPAATSARCCPKGYLVRIHRTCSLFLILSIRPSTAHLADTRPHSPMTLTYEPITHTSIITAPMPSMAKLIMHRHVGIACFRFPFVNLAHIMSRFLIAFFDALNSPCVRTCVDTYSSPASLCPSRIPPVVHYNLSTTDDRTKLLDEHVKHVHTANNSQRTSSGNRSASHIHQHHYERCYDYDSFRCRSTVTIALFAYVIVNHDNSRVASNTYRHPALDICRLPEVRDEEVKTDTMLHNVMLETSVPPIANSLPTPIHVLLTVSPSSTRSLIYISFIAYERAIHHLSSSLTDVQTPLLDPNMAFGLTACGYAARLDLYSFHALMLMCDSIVPLLVARVAPIDDQTLKLPIVQRDHLRHLVRFAFVVLDRYDAPSYVISHG